MSFEQINKKLVEALMKYDEVMFNQVVLQPQCDIDGSFMGFVEHYYYLSKLIPKDWTVIDFGCAYAPQAYYFRKHVSYIGVDCNVIKRFTFDNTRHIWTTIGDFLNETDIDDRKTFAICNFVPSTEVELVKRFKNLFIYYPEK